MSIGPDFSEYDKRMEDPEYRARMDRTAPFTEGEESKLYELLDEALAAEQDTEEGASLSYSEDKFDALRSREANPEE
jgi:hypothetical protein